ncbi:MAG: HesA/MoeB/ThiF family protein [Muribaculaceae bacterium]|jgi:adenylyltransferase/sulfurtransferase
MNTNQHIDLRRYSRQTMLAEIGEEGQRRLLASSVLIVGLGGLGAAVATYLTGAGVGRIGLCDPDRVSLSNLQRQVLYTEQQIGMPKVEEAARRLGSQSSSTRFDLHPDGLTEENGETLAAGYDLLVDCTDNFATRYLIDDICHRLGKPWVYGSIGEFRGQVAVMNHLNGRRYADLYPDREALCALPHKTAGVIGAVPGVIGAMEASEALKLLAGFGNPLDGKLFSIDLLTLSTLIIEF